MAIKSESIKSVDTGVNTIFHTCTWCGQPHSFYPHNGVCQKCGRA